MGQKFNCTSCGQSGVIVGIVATDVHGMTPCPVCRNPVVTYTVTGNEQSAGPKVEPFGDLVFLSVMNGALMLVPLGMLHAALWYVFGVDVTAWGGISLFGFRVPYYYLLPVALALVYFVGVFIENERLKAKSK